MQPNHEFPQPPAAPCLGCGTHASSVCSECPQWLAHCWKCATDRRECCSDNCCDPFSDLGVQDVPVLSELQVRCTFNVVRLVPAVCPSQAPLATQDADLPLAHCGSRSQHCSSMLQGVCPQKTLQQKIAGEREANIFIVPFWTFVNHSNSAPTLFSDDCVPLQPSRLKHWKVPL